LGFLPVELHQLAKVKDDFDFASQPPIVYIKLSQERAVTTLLFNLLT
jgi:hypothetical protein